MIYAYNSRYISQEIKCKRCSCKVQVPPLLHQRHNAVLRLLYRSWVNHWCNFCLRPLM